MEGTQLEALVQQIDIDLVRDAHEANSCTRHLSDKQPENQHNKETQFCQIL